VTTWAWAWLGASTLAAVVDWWAVGRRPPDRGLESLAKPATLVGLIGLALALRPLDPTARALLVVGLAGSLLGDVALLRSERPVRFAVGLGAFLLAHLAYIGALGRLQGAIPLLVVGLVLVGAYAWFVGRPILQAVRGGHEARLLAPVAAYLVVISLMVAVAVGTGRPLAIAGALLFYASDSLLGWDRFVRPLPRRDLLVIVTYHLGQALLVLSLAA
jgi:uncharacterized membrane protein YhhN